MRHFKERQRFNQWWLWIPLLGFQLTTVVLLMTNVIVLEKEDPIPGIILTLSPMIGIGMFLIFRLDTEINEKGIQFKFVPFTKKFYSWHDIEKVEVLDYGFVGGWGIRLWTSYGTVYNIRGSKGLSVKLKNGKHFLIGTQKPEELQETIKMLNLNE